MGEAVIPGQGRIVERAYTPEERAVLGAAISVLCPTTFDTYLSPRRRLVLQTRQLSGA